VKKVISVVWVVLFLVSGLAFAEQKGKIAVSTNAKNTKAAVSDKAGLAPFFLIFDEKGKLIEAVENPFKEEKGKAGHLMTDFLAANGVTVVIGENYCGTIVDVLNNKGVTPFNFKGSAEDAVKKVLHSN
jgi:predicted Fe-Mo cluster-binding NifX family protein